MGLDTDVLRWFQLVVDGATVTEVADVYMVSQPGVSRALNRLDDAVGTPLLAKVGRVLRPTHAGTVFKRHVDALLHGLDDGLAAVNELVDPEAGTVSVGFQLSLGTWLVPRLIKDFRAGHPRVNFRLEHSHDAVGASLLTGGRIDVEFTARLPQDPDIIWRRLFSQPLQLAVPPRHRLAGNARISLADVSGEDFVMARPNWELRATTERLCQAAGFSPRVAFEGDDLSVVLGFVSAGLGVAMVPATSPDARRSDPDGAQILSLTDEGASREVGLAWTRTRRHLPSAQLFREHVLQSAVSAHPYGGGH